VTHAGTGGAETLNGDGAANVMVGGRGDDLLEGDGGADVLQGGEGDDTLAIGDAGFLRLVGGTGHDVLEIGGAMTLDGADFRRIDGIEGIALGDFATDLTLGRIAAHALTGLAADAFRLVIDAAAVADAAISINASGFIRPLTVDLSGNAAASRLSGSDGDDVFSGGGGNDFINGRTGADSMSGGDGDDRFFVDNAGDAVDEDVGDGIDRIDAAIDYTLAAGQEIERLIARAGAGGLELTGNEFANAVSGRDGTDTLEGGNGNDILSGQGDADLLDGGDSDDRLLGGDGADTLDGGAGRDRLRGDAGSDTFAFSSLADSGTAAATRDVIQDFVQGADLIDLVAIDAVAGGSDDAFGFIGDGAFSGTAGELRQSVLGSSTLLSGDVNGDAIADFTILLTGNHVLQGSNFML
jgi:Ca2+-binding RTX toxin-like protein